MTMRRRAWFTVDSGSRRSTRPLLAIGVAFALLLAGVALGRVTARHESTRRAATAVGPVTSRGGLPVGYARSVDGAAAAATTYLATLAGRTVLDPALRGAALDAITLPSARATVDGELRVDPAGAAAAGLTAAMGDGSLIALTIPAGSRVRSYTADAAQVDVWAVSLLGTRTLAHADASWSTTTVSLRWSDGDWRLTDLTSRTGPVPSPGSDVPSRYDDLLAGLDGLGGYTYAPRR